MAKKKYTMQDIANEAGVSKTTVSYVLNNKKEGRISEETRKKILQIANLYDYVPNLSAKALNQVQTKIIGILVPEEEDEIVMYGVNKLVNQLKLALHQNGYNVLFIKEKEKFEYVDFACDGILVVNRSNDTISKIAEVTFAPIFIVDNLYESVFFYAVYNDYKDAIEKAYDLRKNKESKIVVYHKFYDDKLNEYIKSSERDVSYYEYETEEKLCAYVGENPTYEYIVLGEVLTHKMLEFVEPKQILAICDDVPFGLKDRVEILNFSNKEKVKLIVEIFMAVLHKEKAIYDTAHLRKIKLKEENPIKKDKNK